MSSKTLTMTAEESEEDEKIVCGKKVCKKNYKYMKEII